MKPLFLTMKRKSGWTHVQNMCPCAAKLKNLFNFIYLYAAHEAADGRHMAADGRHMSAVGVACGARSKVMKLCVKHLFDATWTHQAHGLRAGLFSRISGSSMWFSLVQGLKKRFLILIF